MTLDLLACSVLNGQSEGKNILPNNRWLASWRFSSHGTIRKESPYQKNPSYLVTQHVFYKMPVLVWESGCCLDDFFRRTNGAIQWHRNLLFLLKIAWTMEMLWIVSKLTAPSRSTLHKTMCQFRIWEANKKNFGVVLSLQNFGSTALNILWRMKTTSTIWTLLQLFLERSSIVGLSSKINWECLSHWKLIKYENEQIDFIFPYFSRWFPLHNICESHHHLPDIF